MEPVADEMLIEQVVSGDEQALALLYDRYGGMAYSLAYKILTDRTSSEDVVQEVFLTLWRKAQSFDIRRGEVRTWLLTMVHHRCIDVIRRQRGKATLQITPDFNHPASEADGVWNLVVHSLDSEAIQNALTQIPEKQKQVIDLAYFGGYTHSEIAEMLQVPLGTVKARIRMGVEKLRNILRDNVLEAENEQSR